MTLPAMLDRLVASHRWKEEDVCHDSPYLAVHLFLSPLALLLPELPSDHHPVEAYHFALVLEVEQIAILLSFPYRLCSSQLHTKLFVAKISIDESRK